jgi:hypothetical protein
MKSLVRFFEMVGTVAGITGALLLSANIEYSRYGYVLFLLSSLMLFGHARLIRANWLMGLQLCFLGTNLNGIYQWVILPVIGGH